MTAMIYFLATNKQTNKQTKQTKQTNQTNNIFFYCTFNGLLGNLGVDHVVHDVASQRLQGFNVNDKKRRVRRVKKKEQKRERANTHTHTLV